MELEELHKKRAEVLHQFISLEAHIVAIITVHYLGTVEVAGARTFMREVFYNSECSFQLKRDLLERILERGYLPADLVGRKFLWDDQAKSGPERLRELAKIRNRFAHCGPSFEVQQDGKTILINPDPEGVDREIDFDSLAQKFVALAKDILPWLQEVKVGVETYIAQQYGTQKSGASATVRG